MLWSHLIRSFAGNYSSAPKHIEGRRAIVELFLSFFKFDKIVCLLFRPKDDSGQSSVDQPSLRCGRTFSINLLFTKRAGKERSNDLYGFCFLFQYVLLFLEAKRNTHAAAAKSVVCAADKRLFVINNAFVRYFIHFSRLSLCIMLLFRRG